MTANRRVGGKPWRVEVLEGDPPSVRDLIARLEADVAEGTRLPPRTPVLSRLIDTARRDDGLPSAAFMRALQATAKQCGLTRADRLELADKILRRDVTTWRGVTVGEAEKLMTAMEGFALIAHLQAEQGRRWRYGACTADVCPMLHHGDVSREGHGRIRR